MKKEYNKFDRNEIGPFEKDIIFSPMKLQFSSKPKKKEKTKNQKDIEYFTVHKDSTFKLLKIFHHNFFPYDH